MKDKLLIILILFAGMNLFSQETLHLTLDEAESFAVEHNRSLQNASLDIRKAEASRWQAIASMLPQVNASLDYANYLGYELNLNGMSIAMNPYGTFSLQTAAAFSAAQVIAVKISDIALSMSVISRDQSEQEIRNQVKILYYSVLVMEETVSLLNDNFENLQDLYQSTLKSVEVGVAEQTDADKLQVQLATMETSINSTKRSLEMLYNSLKLQFGVDVSTKIELAQSIDDLLNVEEAVKLVSNDFVIEKNFTYQLLQKNVELAKEQVTLSYWKTAPSLSAYHQYSYKTYFNQDEGFNMTPPNIIGVSVSIPIFSGLGRYKDQAIAKIAYEEQVNTMDDTKNALYVQHDQLKYNLLSALDSYNTQRKNVEVTQRIFHNISQKYETGMSSSLEVTNAGTNLISAQSSYVQALLELISSQIELEKLLNTENK